MASSFISPVQPRQPRNSSIELFRILATFSVLIVHFNGWFVGGLPEKLDFTTFNWRYGQFIIQGASCVCVNLFIIISGYFGLHFKISSFVRIGLVLTGILIPFYLWGAYEHNSFNYHSFLQKLFIVSQAGYFVQCYLMLIFFSPVLNAFIANNSRRDILIWIILFWLVEIWFGCVKNNENFGFNNGSSIIHFVLVYFMARLLFLYKKEVMLIKQGYWWIGYIIGILILAIMLGLGINWGYANPVNVISSFCLFCPFLYYSFHSRIINWIAKNTFAVYIIQVTYPAIIYLIEIDNKLLNNYSYGIYLILSLLVIILFFFLCILYDKIREYVMSPIERFIRLLIGETLYNRKLLSL